MTEEEAKMKWCPFARDVTGQANGASMAMTSFNRPFGNKYPAFESCQCIGSTCMAWRCLTRHVVLPDAENFEVTEEVIGGYCGLAGRP